MSLVFKIDGDASRLQEESGFRKEVPRESAR